MNIKKISWEYSNNIYMQQQGDPHMYTELNNYYSSCSLYDTHGDDMHTSIKNPLKRSNFSEGICIFLQGQKQTVVNTTQIHSQHNTDTQSTQHRYTVNTTQIHSQHNTDTQSTQHRYSQ